jgi:hypothetical protein
MEPGGSNSVATLYIRRKEFSSPPLKLLQRLANPFCGKTRDEPELHFPRDLAYMTRGYALKSCGLWNSQ